MTTDNNGIRLSGTRLPARNERIGRRAGDEGSGSVVLSDSPGAIYPHESVINGPMPRSHRHPELEINLVTQGTASYLLMDGAGSSSDQAGRSRYDLSQNALVFLFPDQDHLFLTCSDNYRGWLCYFKPEVLQRYCLSPSSLVLCEPDPPGHFCRYLADDMASRLADLFADVAAIPTDTDRYDVGLGYALHTAWAAYGEATESSEALTIHPAVAMAIRLIREDTEPLSAEQLAARAGVSVSYFSRLFGREVGMSVAEFRNKDRLDRFLHDTHSAKRQNLLQAALSAGFGSYAQFHQVFKQRMGCSPSEYRRRTKDRNTTAGHIEPSHPAGRRPRGQK